jgi:hypothetical protein
MDGADALLTRCPLGAGGGRLTPLRGGLSGLLFDASAFEEIVVGLVRRSAATSLPS